MIQLIWTDPIVYGWVLQLGGLWPILVSHGFLWCIPRWTCIWWHIQFSWAKEYSSFTWLQENDWSCLQSIIIKELLATYVPRLHVLLLYLSILYAIKNCMDLHILLHYWCRLHRQSSCSDCSAFMWFGTVIGNVNCSATLMENAEFGGEFLPRLFETILCFCLCFLVSFT